MKFDLTTSTVEIDGRRFPAVGVICPPHESHTADDRSDWDRLLGHLENEVDKFESIYVPCENGTLVELVDNRRDGRFDVWIEARDCVEHVDPWHETRWLPRGCCVRGSVVVPVDSFSRLSSYRTLAGATRLWLSADEDWIAEFIVRISRMPYEPVEPAGPALRLISLREVRDLFEHRDSRPAGSS